MFSYTLFCTIQFDAHYIINAELKRIFVPAPKNNLWADEVTFELTFCSLMLPTYAALSKKVQL
jgi:hypothetical protein